MAGGGGNELPIPDPRFLLPAQHMVDLEKGDDREGMDTPARQVPEMAGGEEQEHRILKDLRVDQPPYLYEHVEGVAAVGTMNPVQKKWLAYWLLVAAASVIFLNNHIDAAPMDRLFPPELPMFIVFLCAICLILQTMKQHR